MKKNIILWVRIAVSLLAVSFVLVTFRGRWHEVFELLAHIRWSMLAGGFLILLFTQVLITARLQGILLAQEVHVEFWVLFRLTMIAIFFNNFLPSAVGGDAVKAYYAGKHSQRRLEPYTAVFTDRMIGYVTLICWSVFALWLFRDTLDNPAISNSVYVLLGIAVCVTCFFASRRISSPYHWLIERIPSDMWRDRFRRIYDGVNVYRNHPRLILLSILISGVAQFLMIVMFWVLARGLQLPISLGVFMLVIPIVSIVQNAPSINGVGVRESAFVYFLRDFTSPEGALALSLTFYVVFLVASLVGGIIYAAGGAGVRLDEIRKE